MLRLLFLTLFIPFILHAGSLSVASAKGYKKPVMRLFKAFEKTQRISVTPIFGNMRQVIAQTQLSGSVSLLVGDRAFLERSDLNVHAYIPLGQGKLVLAYPKGSTLEQIGDITKKAIRKIALPDPKKAIYGKAAMQYLRGSGLLPKVEKRLLTVGTVPQVSAYLIAREIDAGFINLTDAIGIRDKVGGYIEADTTLYTPIDIVCAVIAGHENEPETQAFIAFLKTPEARAVLEASGL